MHLNTRTMGDASPPKFFKSDSTQDDKSGFSEVAAVVFSMADSASTLKKTESWRTTVRMASVRVSLDEVLCFVSGVLVVGELFATLTSIRVESRATSLAVQVLLRGLDHDAFNS